MRLRPLLPFPLGSAKWLLNDLEVCLLQKQNTNILRLEEESKSLGQRALRVVVSRSGQIAMVMGLQEQSHFSRKGGLGSRAELKPLLPCVSLTHRVLHSHLFIHEIWIEGLFYKSH